MSARSLRAGRRGAAAALVAAAVLLALAALPRLLGVDYGLPQVYNADEPHLVNSAVALGGSLRPHSFKYPTFWPAVLAAAYGLWFALWSGFGALRGTAEFAAKFAFEPGGFYLIARLLAAASQLGAIWLIAREEREQGRWPLGAAALALSPVLVELAHSAKPDSLMLLLSTGAWLTALRFQSAGERKWLLASALLAGLACSTQYTAAPVALAAPMAWLLRRDGPAPLPWLVQAGVAAGAGFALGTPYAVLESGRFLADWKDYGDLGRLYGHDAALTARQVARNFWCFAGEGSLAGAAALLGLAALWGRDPRRALLLLVPMAVHAALLSSTFNGGVSRYLVAAYPALALLAGEGLGALGGERAWRRALAALVALAPSAWLTAGMARQFTRPDTRAQSTEWLAREVPAGSTLLLDQAHAGPMALMSREQCAELAARTERAGSPRARLFRAMADHHPGGGYRIYRIQRTARDLWSSPKHVAMSQADGDFLDVRPGLDPVRAVRVDYVVTSSFGADPRRSRELASFFSELWAQAELVREFPSSPDGAAGPWLRVYRLKRS